MRGTLALWYEPLRSLADSEPRAADRVEQTPRAKPKVELHFNLWRDLSSWTNSLDVGLLLSDVADVQRIYLYIPSVIQPEHISDLAPVLRVGPTLNAVFNEVVTLGAETDDSYEISIRGADAVSVLFLKAASVLVEPFKEGENNRGTRVVLTDQICSLMRAVPGQKFYIRFRINLLGGSADLFSSEMLPRDRIFAPAISRLELTEFRLNERRSYPSRILELADHNDFEITAIHYFLIRDLQYQLVVQHAPFRKVRRLERELWADYLAGSMSSRNFRLGAKLASRLVIYHWKKEANGQAIEGFIAFSSFRSSTTSLATYALVIVLLGAMGSALEAAASAYLTDHLPEIISWLATCASPQGCLAIVNSTIFIVIALGLFALAISIPTFTWLRRMLTDWTQWLIALIRKS